MRVQTIHTKNLRWTDIVDPSAEEVQWVRTNFNFNEPHLRDLAEHQLRSHIEHGQNYEFLVLLFPVYRKETQEIIPGEIDFFVSDGLVVTAHYGDIHTVKQLFNSARSQPPVREVLFKNGPGFLLYKILEALFRRSYPILDHMNEDVNDIEVKIFREQNRDMLSKIALMKKNVIEFRKMMKTHHHVLERLPKLRAPYLTFSQSKLYYKDLLEYSQNIWDILETLKETAESLAETNQSIATQQLNEITKMISIFSAIFIPATLVAFIFGIGVENVPFRYHPNGFWIVMTLMALASLLLIFFFKKKKWF